MKIQKQFKTKLSQLKRWQTQQAIKRLQNNSKATKRKLKNSQSAKNRNTFLFTQLIYSTFNAIHSNQEIKIRKLSLAMCEKF